MPRYISRRYDPLKRRSLEEWRQVFARYHRVTAALICASRKVLWDYPVTAQVVRQYADQYHRLTKLPTQPQIERCLIQLGYSPAKAHRVLTAMSSYSGDHPAIEVNAFSRHLDTLVAAAYREDQDTGSVSVMDLCAKQKPR